MNHIIPKSAKVVAVVTLAAGSVVGAYAAPHALAAHLSQPTEHVSYASQSTIDRTVRLANHTPAHQGAFRDSASIIGGEVQSAVVEVAP